jgi:hypothetical protein
LGVGFERDEKKGEKSAPKFIPSSNYHKEEEALKPTKTHYTSNPKSSFKPKRDVKKETPSRERKLLYAYFVAVLVTWMSFASGARGLRGGTLSMPKIHIVMSFLIFCLALSLSTLPHTSSHALSRFFHGPNHRSYGFGSRENSLVPRHFGYGPHPHRGDRFLRMPSFPVDGSHTHPEPRHLDGPRSSHCGSHPTRPNGEVQRTMKTFSGRMVKCWIPKIYLTNPSTEPLTSSYPM